MGCIDRPVVLSIFVLLLASGCRSFSRGGVSLAARRSRLSTHVRHPHPSCYYPLTPLGGDWLGSAAVPLTVRWSSPTESAGVRDTSVEKQTTPELDLHPPTLQAIAQALLVRAQNTPGMPLRFVEDGSMEEWEITLTAGKVAQQAAEEWAKQNGINPLEDDELLQVMAGRVVAVLTRLEELEEELLKRCNACEGISDDFSLLGLGVPTPEMKAWQSTESDPAQRISDAAAAIDATCLFDAQLRYDRARSLLAIFLHEIEGPGLRRNNVVIPCMDVDFLSDEEWKVLLRPVEVEGAKDEFEGTGAAVDSPAHQAAEKPDMKEARPSLHPITIDAIEEAFRLRAQNSTTSPLRLFDGHSEWFDVQYSIVKFADRFLEKYTKASSKGKGDIDEFQCTEEELQTIGGRIVGVLMRLDDLEWEWNHRITTSPLAEADSPSMIPNDMWKTTLGLHPGDVEQSCIRTIDLALSEERDFARARAERMLALFLLNIEQPGMEASGNVVPGGSHPHFIEDALQLELMTPRPRPKKE